MRRFAAACEKGQQNYERRNQSQTGKQEACPAVRLGYGKKPGTQIHPGWQGLLHGIPIQEFAQNRAPVTLATLAPTAPERLNIRRRRVEMNHIDEGFPPVEQVI